MADDIIQTCLDKNVSQTEEAACASVATSSLPTTLTPSITDKPREVALFESVLESPYKLYASYILEAAYDHGVPAVLIWAIMARESSGQAAAVNGLKDGDRTKATNSPSWLPGDDHGLMQISWKYHKKWFEANRDESLPDTEWVRQPYMAPHNNIQKGAEVLKECFKVFNRPEAISSRYTQILPLTGEALLLAAVAAYNAGPAAVLAVLHAQPPQPAESATYPFKNPGKSGYKPYAPQIISNAQLLRFKLIGKDQTTGDAQGIAMMAFDPRPEGAAKRMASVYLYAKNAAQVRSERMATSLRDVYSAENTKMKLRLNAVANLDRTTVTQGVAVASIKPPSFQQDANLTMMTYDWKTGLWGDGKPV